MFWNRVVSMAVTALILITLLSGCRKKAPIAVAPPPPDAEPAVTMPPRPTVVLSAEPEPIEQGQTTTLRWSSTDAEKAFLDQEIGEVDLSGSIEVSPAVTTAYTVSARGPGGEASAMATVSVRVPAPPDPPSAPVATFSQELSRLIDDIYFDYDRYDLRRDAHDTLSQNAQALQGLFQSFPGARVIIEGHCDERGSSEYNLALGDRRARAAYDFLLVHGIPTNRLNIVSYGKEQPQCFESQEPCWQRNRRAHFRDGTQALSQNDGYLADTR